MRNLILAVLLVLGIAGAAAAQPLPQPWTPQFDGDLGDVIEYYNQRLTDLADRKRMRDEVVTNRKAMEAALKWSGQRGFLIEQRVQKTAGPTGWQRRPLGGPVMHGVGATPADAYAASTLRTSLEPPLPTYQLDPDSSFFIWVEPHRTWTGAVKLRPAEIPPGEGFAGAVRQEALAQLADVAVARASLEDHRARVLEGMVKQLRRETANAERRERLDRQYLQYRQQRDKVREIQTRLDQELRRAQRVDGLMNTLNVLRSVATVATMVMQVEAALDNPPTQQLRNARTPDDVIRITDEYRRQTGDRVETYRREMTVEGPRARDLQLELGDMLRQGNAPPTLQNRLFLCPTDHPGCP
jgi:hypothetical protein